MNSFSNISNLKQLEQEKTLLKKRISKQENVVMSDLSTVHSSAQKWVNGIFRIKNIVQFFLPKVEIFSVLFPVIKKLIRRRKK